MGKGCWDLQNDIVAKTRELTHRWQAIKLFGYMVVVAQLVRASDCGSEGRGFEPRLPPLSFTNVFPGRTRFPAYRQNDERPYKPEMTTENLS